jgi:chromosome segregation ATPase
MTQFGWQAGSTVAGTSSPPASGTVQGHVRTLTGAIQQLEGQLDRMVEVNDSLRRELEEERKRRGAAERQADEIRSQLRLGERKATDRENLLGEIQHLSQERARLTTTVRELTTKLTAIERQHDEQKRLLDRLRASRAALAEELASVESQFERAMQLIAYLESRVRSTNDERDSLSARLRTTELTLDELRAERDALVSEVEQSRAALDEIRRSLVDAFEGPDSDPPSDPPARPRPAPGGAK